MTPWFTKAMIAAVRCRGRGRPLRVTPRWPGCVPVWREAWRATREVAAPGVGGRDCEARLWARHSSSAWIVSSVSSARRVPANHRSATMSWLGLASVRARRRASSAGARASSNLAGHRAAHQAVEVELEVGVVGGTDGVECSPAGCERLRAAAWSPAKESAPASALCAHPGEGVSGGSPSRSASDARVRARSRSPSRSAFQAAAVSTAQRRPGVEVSARSGRLRPIRPRRPTGDRRTGRRAGR